MVTYAQRVAEQLAALDACVAAAPARPSPPKSQALVDHEAAQDQRAEERKAGRYLGRDLREEAWS